jgi:GNAT superfamily N-acetyltransferase
VDEFVNLGIAASAPSHPNAGSAAVHRVQESARDKLLAHFVALSDEDRRLRFGAFLSTESVERYVLGVDFGRDVVFGVFDDELSLVGAAHVAFAEGSAELGLSVLPGQRDRGVGSALFARAAAHARNRSVSSLYMHCLSENAAIMHIAKKSGMTIVAASGDADAHLTLSPANPASITGEYLTDRLALYDYALKAHVAAWRRVNAVLEGVSSAR